MSGQLEILNVGEGDVKITFDTNDCADAIRAKRIITDMLRRGYALLVEVDGKFQRALEFDDARGEYIIADFDPLHKVTESDEYTAVDHVLQAETLPLPDPSEYNRPMHAHPDAAPPMPHPVVELADGREGRLENGKYQVRKTSGKASAKWITVDGRTMEGREIRKLLGRPDSHRGRRRANQIPPYLPEAGL